MTDLYVLTKYLTFPGCLMRGFWQQVVCRFSKVPVEDNRYLRRDETCGHIEHEFMPKATGAFDFCFVPAFMMSIMAFMLLLIPSFITIYLEIGDIYLKLMSAVSYWFGISFIVNAYPMIEDAMNMMNKVYKQGNILQKIFYAPSAAILYAGAYLERYCITFIFAVIATILLIVG